MAAFTRFFKQTVSVAALLTCLGVSHAGELDMDAIDKIVEYSNKIMDEAERQERPDWLIPKVDGKTNQTAREALGIVDSGNVSNGLAAKSGAYGARAGWERKQPVVFVSFSIPNDTLKRLLLDARESNISVIFRGIPQGEKLNYVSRRVKAILGEESPPGVLMDPMAFRREQVTEVPTYLYPKNSGEPLRVLGASAAPEWVASNVSRPGSTTVLGPTYEVQEPDLVEEMKRRMAMIDWGAKKEQVRNSFWKKVPFIELPEAKTARTFTYDPSIVVTKNIEYGGRIVAKAGERVNPFDHIKLSKKIVVFDGRVKWQFEWAKNFVARETKEGRNTLLITIGVNREDGFRDIDAMSMRTKRPVYLLSQLEARKMHLEAVPSVVAQDGKLMKVTEVPNEE